MLPKAIHTNINIKTSYLQLLEVWQKIFIVRKWKWNGKRGMPIWQSSENSIITFWFPYLENLKEKRSLESDQCATAFNKFDMILQYFSYKNQQNQISIAHTEILFLKAESCNIGILHASLGIVRKMIKIVRKMVKISINFTKKKKMANNISKPVKEIKITEIKKKRSSVAFELKEN